MGNRTYTEKTLNGTVVEWHRYEYNESNQLISEKLYNGKKTTSLAYNYDADGNRISETGRIGTDTVSYTRMTPATAMQPMRRRTTARTSAAFSSRYRRKSARQRQI